MSALPYQPHISSRLNKQPRILKHQFGDGYAQRMADGINNNLERWSLSFTLINANALALMTFFDGLGGVDSFTWQPPGAATARNYVCESYGQSKIDPKFMQIDAQVVEDIQP